MDMELAWAAGIFEGEGCIQISKYSMRNRRNPRLLISICNTDVDLLEPFQRRWPGYWQKQPPQSNRRPAWRWVLEGAKAFVFLEAIEPHTRRRVVRTRIEVARRFMAQREQATYHERATAAYRRTQVDFYWQIRELNGRGTKPVERPSGWDEVETSNHRGESLLSGDRQQGRKLTSAQAREIARRRVAGELLGALASEYGIDKSRVCQLAQESIAADSGSERTSVRSR